MKSFGNVLLQDNKAVIGGFASNKLYYMPDMNKKDEYIEKTFEQNQYIGCNSIFKNKVLAHANEESDSTHPGIYVFEPIDDDWSNFAEKWKVIDSTTSVNNIVNHNDTLYALTARNGILYSTDAYQWNRLDKQFSYIDSTTGQFFYESLSLISINDNYMLTYTRNNGIYISFDRGKNWELINSQLSNIKVGDYLTDLRFNDIFISKDNIFLDFDT